MGAREVIAVLLVDDNPADLDLMRDVFEQGRRCRISTAQDGEQALAMLNQAKDGDGRSIPDLLVLDLNLPRRHGQAVLAELKSDPVLKRTPVLVFTTSQAERDIEMAYESGANGYVSKPGNLKDFIAAVKSIEEFWFCLAHLPRRVPA
jgi:CheY-like chemotaxis protein